MNIKAIAVYSFSSSTISVELDDNTILNIELDENEKSKLRVAASEIYLARQEKIRGLLYPTEFDKFSRPGDRNLNI